MNRLTFRTDINSLHHIFDDGVVMFNPETKDTTLFNPIVGWLIDNATNKPFTEQDSLNNLLGHCHQDCPIQLTELFSKTIDSLVKLGFLQRI